MKNGKNLSRCLEVLFVSASYFTLVVQLLVTALACSNVTSIISTGPCEFHTALALFLGFVLLVDYHDCSNDGPKYAEGGEQTE